MILQHMLVVQIMSLTSEVYVNFGYVELAANVTRVFTYFRNPENLTMHSDQNHETIRCFLP